MTGPAPLNFFPDSLSYTAVPPPRKLARYLVVPTWVSGSPSTGTTVTGPPTNDSTTPPTGATTLSPNTFPAPPTKSVNCRTESTAAEAAPASVTGTSLNARTGLVTDRAAGVDTALTTGALTTGALTAGALTAGVITTGVTAGVAAVGFPTTAVETDPGAAAQFTPGTQSAGATALNVGEKPAATGAAVLRAGSG